MVAADPGMGNHDFAEQTWQVMDSSVRGASHVRLDMENQDASGHWPESGTGREVVLAVSDGHGSPRSFRSARGARLAVEASVAIGREIIAVASDPVADVRDAMDRLGPTLVGKWRSSVDRELEATPLSEEELGLVATTAGVRARLEVERDAHLAYGATVIGVVVGAEIIAYWQLGDGDVVVVRPDGTPSRPLPRDDLLLGNETTSLCSTEAWRYVRVGIDHLFGFPPDLVVAATDGLANSFSDDEGFLKFSSDLARRVRDEGVEAIDVPLESWLTRITQAGSGDDITVGVVCRGTFAINRPAVSGGS